MTDLTHLLKSNRNWAKKMLDQDSDYFNRLADQQSPEYLWIGCSDSRVPANQIVDLAPGEMFVHRNIANIVHATDYNCHSVLQFAVDVLKVKHVIVCGHYGCGGIRAAMANHDNGLVDTWLRQVKETYVQHEHDLQQLASSDEQVNRLCELNVKTQVYNLCKSKVLQKAWTRGQDVTVHGWIYSIYDGIVKDLEIATADTTPLHPIFKFDE